MSDLDPYWAHADYSLYIYMGRKLYLRKPYNPSSRLLGLAYRAPIRRLRVTSSAPTTLLFNLLRNYYCRNKPTDALVLQPLLYYYRVIRGRPLLAPYSPLLFPLQPRTSLVYFG